MCIRDRGKSPLAIRQAMSTVPFNASHQQQYGLLLGGNKTPSSSPTTSNNNKKQQQQHAKDLHSLQGRPVLRSFLSPPTTTQTVLLIIDDIALSTTTTTATNHTTTSDTGEMLRLVCGFAATAGMMCVGTEGVLPIRNITLALGSSRRDNSSCLLYTSPSPRDS
eukprot:TRINITY_DN21303_c0_g1_i1.p1 TRINITY_DN21303_c0_g1~~TRINITY_DN21303_c0_g1_i1.p1  ORF type:complete len:173 (-),score=47.19 TRINITY_DN21303_c0_g1_i1:6-497(-)